MDKSITIIVNSRLRITADTWGQVLQLRSLTTWLLLACSSVWSTAQGAEFVPLGAGAWETSGTYQYGYRELLYPVGTTPDGVGCLQGHYDGFFPGFSDFYEEPVCDVTQVDYPTFADTPTVSTRGFSSVIISDNARVVTGSFDRAGSPARFEFGPNGEMTGVLDNTIYHGGETTYAVDLSPDGQTMAYLRKGGGVSRNTGFGRGRDYLNIVTGDGDLDPKLMPEPLMHWAMWGGMWGLKAMSGDGQVLVGYATNLGVPFRWDAADRLFRVLEGMDDVVDTSFDGSVVVGGSYRWSLEDGLDHFGPEPTDAFTYAAEAVSADGEVIAGTAVIEGKKQAFRWTEASGIVPVVAGDETSRVTGMSADGSTIIGSVETVNGFEPFRWTAETGMQTLVELLSAGGADLAGYELGEATGVSGDGMVIVGSGRNGEGATSAWLARIAVVPEPTSFAIVAVVGLALQVPRRRA